LIKKSYQKMKKMSTISMEQSRSIVYNKANVPQTGSKSTAATNIKSTSLIQVLKEVRHELKQVTRERDSLRNELLNCIQIV
jgi:hypothetical protein